MSGSLKYVSTEQDLHAELSKYITALTTTGNKTLDEKIMKKIKDICRRSDNYVEYVFHLLMTQFRKEHSEIRFSALLITNELFCRSHKFRTLLLAEFQEFLQLCAETDPDELLPPPKAAAKLLKQKTLEFVQNWYNKFKEGYKLLVIAFNFLNDCKQVNFADLEARSIAQRAQEDETRQRLDSILNVKVEKATKTTTELAVEIDSVIEQMENCYRLLHPYPDVYFEKSDFAENKEDNTQSPCKEEVDKVDNKPGSSRQESMRHHGLINRNLIIPVTMNNDTVAFVEENYDTSPLLGNIRDLHRQIVSHLQPAVLKVLKVFTKAGCEEKIKHVIDLKCLLESAMEKFNEMKIIPREMSSSTTAADSDEDDFEDVAEKEGTEEVIPVHRRTEYGLEPMPSTSKTSAHSVNERHWDLKVKVEEMKDPTTRLANLNALCQKLNSKEEKQISRASEKINLKDQEERSQVEPDNRKVELLSKAPKKNFDIDLYHWEDEKLEAPSVIQFDSLHKFWQPRENETTEFQDQEGIAALRRRVIEFSGEFQPVKWSCRAPLPSGKLCPRRDRKKCPFHGPIIPRDNMGNPVDSSHKDTSSLPSTSKADPVPDWQDPTLLKEIEAATGLNLKIPKKYERKKKKKDGSDTNLTNIKVTQNTTRRRLEKKVLEKNSVKRVAQTLDRLDHKKFRDKYGDQWNYAFNV